MATATLEKRPKAERTRKVFKEHMVAHLWANQAQDEARNQTNTFYFTGDIIYSYGSHFPIARHIKVGKGAEERRCVFFTTEDHSVTTSGHKSTVSAALRSGTVFFVPYIYSVRGPDNKWQLQHAANLKSYQKRISDAAKKAIAARSRKSEWLSQAAGLVTNGNAYIDFFKLKRKAFFMPTELDLKAELEKAARAGNREQKKREKELALRAEKARIDAAAWMEGSPDVETWQIRGLPETYLRVMPHQDHTDPDGSVPEKILETSKGAEVPLAHAVRVLPLIRSGKAYKHNGHSEHVGHFVIDEISAEGDVSIGCHFVKRAEIERIAAQLGL